MANPLNTKIAIYPGSFDPVTLGHLDVIRRAAGIFDRLVVAVIENPSKSSFFTVRQRLELIQGELARLQTPGVEAASFSGLAVEAARRFKARWIVRGLRSESDAAFELPMALSNRRCGVEEIETVFLPSSAGVSFISSTLVREIALHGGELAAFVPPAVERALRAKRGRGDA